jgi:hypothetical protein
MENTSPLINIYENDQELLFKKVNFFSLILPNYIEKQYNGLFKELTADERDNFLTYYIASFKKMDMITKEYGNVIKDFFLAKIKEIYKIPNLVSFNEDNELDEMPLDELDEDKVEENDDDNEILKDEISHYLIKNSLVTGATFLNEMKIFKLIKNELNNLQPNLYVDIDNFLNYSLLYFSMNAPIKKDNLPIAGYERVEFKYPDKDKNAQKINVTAKGINVIVTCHEMLKGIFDIFNEKSFMTDKIRGHNYYQSYLRQVVNNYYLEQWEWSFGLHMWYDLVEKKWNTKESYFKYVSDIFGKDYSQLLDFLL